MTIIMCGFCEHTLLSCILTFTNLLFTGLQICGGQAGVPGKYEIVTMPSETALVEYKQINVCPPSDPAKFALKFLSVFFTTKQLARSNCTKAGRRELLDQDILQAIKHTCFNVQSFQSVMICTHVRIFLQTKPTKGIQQITWKADGNKQ